MNFRAAGCAGEIMKCPKKPNMIIILSVVFGLGASVAAFAQTTQLQNQNDPGQTQAQNPQTNQGNDLRLLGLTPDQIQKIRAINLDLKDERQIANLKLREAQRTLAEAVESPTPNEK